MWRRAVPSLSLLTPLALVPVVALCETKTTKQRKTDFPLTQHSHGKTRVRVLKVRRAESGVHSVSEYNVSLTLFAAVYERVYTADDNSELVATDTQKNTVYVVAKRTEATTPEDFGLAIADHMLSEYPILSGVTIDVKEVAWRRAVVPLEAAAADGLELPHAHGFLRSEPEFAKARVEATRGAAPTVTSSIGSLVLLKTTQSSFSGFARDRYTLLPECEDRCMATELNTSWTYTAQPADYAATRATVKAQILAGFFGPPAAGIFSASLQATVYDAGCLVLAAVPEVRAIEIDTPNLHYLPCKALDAMGETFENDVFIPTSEPSGSITCTVSRDETPTAQTPFDVAKHNDTQDLLQTL